MSSSSRSAYLHEEGVPSKSEAQRISFASGIPFVGEAGVDIIAVQGLASSYERTWSYRTNSETGERFKWLKERLSKDIPYARILAFEYASEWYDNPVGTSLESCGRQLLDTLVSDRCHSAELRMCSTRRKRPIVFIGHSFGGLVIKQALILASQKQERSDSINVTYANYRDILSCTTGILFLGTPHRGSCFTWAAKMRMGASSWISGKEFNRELITLLDLDNGSLKYLQNQFEELQHASELTKLYVACCYESKAFKVPFVGEVYVVSYESACLNGAEQLELVADHNQLNKFHPDPDGNYDRFLALLRRGTETASTLVQGRFNNRAYGDFTESPELQNLRSWLRPSRDAQNAQLRAKMPDRFLYPQACRWINGNRQYKSWLSSEPGTNVLWINGKPGSGKSSLAASIVHNLLRLPQSLDVVLGVQVSCSYPLSTPYCRRAKSPTSVLYFFCGVDKTKETIKSFLGTLIHQLLSSNTDNEDLIRIARAVYSRDRELADARTLIALFKQLAARIWKTYIIIDGIEQISDPTAWIQSLSFLASDEYQSIRLLIISHGTSEISRSVTRHFPHAPSIDITQHTGADMDHYVEAAVRELVWARRDYAPFEVSIREKLRCGAMGMFQWLKTMTDNLAAEGDATNLSVWLDDLPKGLTDTWDLVIKRKFTSSEKARASIKAALQWLCVAARPLSVLELVLAIDFSTDHANIDRWIFPTDPIEVLDERAVVRIQRLLDAFVQTSRQSNSLHQVQLAHPSLERALTAAYDRTDDPEIKWILFDPSEAHEAVSLVCMKMCSLTKFNMSNAFGSGPKHLSQYAWEHWAYHYKKSASASLNVQTQLLDTFDGMISGVSQDILGFLCALGSFVAQPLSARIWTNEAIESIVCLQRAQKAMSNPLVKVMDLRSVLPIGTRLKEAQRLARKAEHRTRANDHFEGSQMWRKNPWSKGRDLLLGQTTSVVSLKAEEFLRHSNADYGRPDSSSLKLWHAAQALRAVTLKFAVNPLYSALMQAAGGAHFSPIHYLVHSAALLEEAGNYPYWPHLPVKRDALEPFLTSPRDSEHGPAKFVIHCVDFRHHTGTETQPSSDKMDRVEQEATRIHLPDPGNAPPDRKVSAVHKAMVKRLHEVPESTFWATRFRLNLFGSSDQATQRYVLNPLQNQYLKTQMHLDTAGPFVNPRTVLDSQAPASVVESRIRSYLRALPNVITTMFAGYVAMLFMVFADLSRRALALQLSRLEMGRMNVAALWFWTSRAVRSEGNARVIDILLGLVLMALRNRYFPSWGRYYFWHPWADFRHCFFHAAAYLNVYQERNFWDFWAWDVPISVFKFWVVNTGGMSLQGWIFEVENNVAENLSETKEPISPGKIRCAYSLYFAFLFLLAEQAVFSALLSFAITIATGNLMFHDPDAVRNLVTTSLTFWYFVAIGLVSNIINLAAAGEGSILGIILGAIFQIIAILLAVYYFDSLAGACSRLFKPILSPLWHLFKVLFWTHKYAIKASGVAGFVFVVWKTFWMIDGWLWDPYDTSGSAARLLSITQEAAATLPAQEHRRIGHFPLGGDARLPPIQKDDIASQNPFQGFSNSRTSEVHDEEQTSGDASTKDHYESFLAGNVSKEVLMASLRR